MKKTRISLTSSTHELKMHKELGIKAGSLKVCPQLGTEAESGATGVELLLPLVLKWAHEGKQTLVDALAKVTCNAAQILKIDAGHLSIGTAADICIFDPACHWKVEPLALKSQGKNTPFLNMELQGKVRYTLVNGQFVYQSE